MIWGWDLECIQVRERILVEGLRAAWDMRR